MCLIVGMFCEKVTPLPSRDVEPGLFESFLIVLRNSVESDSEQVFNVEKARSFKVIAPLVR